MASSQQHHAAYIGRPANELPTPSFVLSKSVMERNVNRMLHDVKEAGILFRPHVKTLKSIEVTRLMLGNGQHRGIVASTVSEIRGALPLVEEGLLDQCLYGLPVYPGVLPELKQLRDHVEILLMVDNVEQLESIRHFNASAMIDTPWKIFVKVDVGSQRAGLPPMSTNLASLVAEVGKSSAVVLYGFYCHAGHSYGCKNVEEASEVLQQEIKGVEYAASLLPATRPLVLSVGATPTAHVISNLKSSLQANFRLELHAGNFPANDLQQVATGLVEVEDQAIRILAEVCSKYEERNEIVVNAGVVALARESGPVPGYARLVEDPNWHIGRVSQEHGILVTTKQPKESGLASFYVGKKVFLHVQHACITAAAHYEYFIVDEQDIVREIWYPWKGWR